MTPPLRQLGLALTLGALVPTSAGAAPGPTVDFVRQIKPILVDNCYPCHSADRIRGKLRLDSRTAALAGGASGPALAPGDSGKSYLLQRILGAGDEPQMPLGKPPLPPEQVGLIRSWIDQGAPWPEDSSKASANTTHWSFVKPVPPALPVVKDRAWVRNPIDGFVLARLEKEGLHPSPEADRATLIRRASLDLTGLPPTLAEVDAFVADRGPDAYEKVVDRLLSSPHFGEQWGRHWLDIARYADTNGYEKDRARTIWPYRDWVINALNSDLPFDQFTVEQLAGDMLPNATPAQRVATGFHRNTMINEEGGIDVEEFRYKAMVDRVQTTATAWLGVTLQCAQCHNHKYDPLSQKDYYRFYALLNNADEPEYMIPSPEVAAKRAAIEAQIAKLEAGYEESFPTGETNLQWTALKPAEAKAQSAATLTARDDGSVLASGPVPDTDSYTLSFTGDLNGITALRLEALTDPSLPNSGPGRAGAKGNGNFVVTEFKVTATAPGGVSKAVELAGAQADFEQPRFAASAAIDGDSKTGWAIDDGSGHRNRNRAATFNLKQPLTLGAGATLAVTIEQAYSSHTLGCFRLLVGRTEPAAPAADAATARQSFLSTKLAEWEQQTAAKCAHWTVLEPLKYSRHYGGSINKLPDFSLLFSGDNYYRDEYVMEFESTLPRITGLRLELLPDPSLPNGGPGRNPTGGWLISELGITAAPPDNPGAVVPLALSNASADVGSAPQQAIDGKKDTHWAVPNGDARPHAIVFQVADAPATATGSRLVVSLLENYHQQENVGRLRLSVTADATPAQASGLPADVEAMVLAPADQRTPDQLSALKRYFLATTPLLAAAHQQVAALRASLPKYQTTMVMEERAAPRVTNIHRRGEFLNLGDEVAPGVPSVLPPLPADAPANRLALARWLVSPQNPLVGRVVMNRTWSLLFGRGIVPTVEDFGTMGEPPSHPELLDWLATEFPRRGWSLKAMLRLMVTSATYRQSSRVSPELLTRDPANVLLARGPRFRVEGETVRDIALVASGLLGPKIGGPSVYPPQPDGVVDLSWGPMKWDTSAGGDRYRRGMYTFLKRTSPYPELTAFDGPTAELTCPRRIRSDTPLQALTTLNDAVFMEASQALARRVVAAVAAAQGGQDVVARARLAFRLCLSRPAEPGELEQLTGFYNSQLARFRDGSANAAAVAGVDAAHPPKDIDVNQLAAWTLTARVLLNLDETITKE